MTSPTGQAIGGEWMRFKGKLKEVWGALTDNDLDRYEGQLDQLIGHVQKSTGKAREEIASDVDRLARETKYRF